MNDPMAELVRRLYTPRRTPKEITKRVNKPLSWLQAIVVDAMGDIRSGIDTMLVR